ncbi:MAG: hydrolase [Candidatus Bipolaricaulota bacterium]
MPCNDDLSEVYWVVLDVDGVLIDVRRSYDLAVMKTVEHFAEDRGSLAGLTLDSIRKLRRRGLFGNDFQVSEALIASLSDGPPEDFVSSFPSDRGIQWVRKRYPCPTSPEEVRHFFNTVYLGRKYSERLFDCRGLWREEEVLVETDLLHRLDQRGPLGVITGRSELELSLAEDLLGFEFNHAVTREWKVKPDPACLRVLVGPPELEPFGVYIGDTLNDQKLVENFRAGGADFGFLMVGRDVEDVNQALLRLVDDD